MDTTNFYRILKSPTGEFAYYDLALLREQGHPIEKLPFSIRILVENILRNQNQITFTPGHLDTVLRWKPQPEEKEIPYLPGRVLMQDFTGVPAIVDLASIRSEAARRKLDVSLINPRVPVDLIIDHSVQVDFFGTRNAYLKNVDLEYERNHERYSLLKWAQSSFRNFNVLPPGMGICHQVNLEYLAQVATVREGLIFPDTLVGTDSHTPMVNGIGVVGWGVGGIEAEAAMLGQPIYIMLPEVVGLKFKGKLREGTSSTDLVLTVAELLRKTGVVGKFVEVFGEGLDHLTVPDRATISNMSPEFGCTVVYFPPDAKTLEYLASTGRDRGHIATVESYMKTNLLWRENEDMISYSRVVELDLDQVVPSLAGPRRPQDKIPLSGMKDRFIEILKTSYARDYLNPDQRPVGQWANEGGQPQKDAGLSEEENRTVAAAGIEVKEAGKKEGIKSALVSDGGSGYTIRDGAVVIAAITSCTNTSNPGVMIGAGLIARKAVERGLKTKPWVKTSLAPGSRVVTTYLEKAGLIPFLEALGFHVVGYGCTTCIGNSGPLPAPVNKAVVENELIVSAVLSGNRNFEARIHPLVKMNFLTSPILVVAYALAGRIDTDLYNEPIGTGPNLEPVYLRDIWPTGEEIQQAMGQVLDPGDYLSNYRNIFSGDKKWEGLPAATSETYQWNEQSSYIREAPFFRDIPADPLLKPDISGARVLLKLGDSITTDHISPAGSIAENSPAAAYLKSLGTEKRDFNSYGSRRGNHEVMIRGTFANVRLKNELADREGSWTRYQPGGDLMPVYEASMRYQTEQVPLIVLAGKEYGSGSSRDWAAKGTALLGIKAILAESFERIHRSNLVGMGVLPLQFKSGENCESLGLRGEETFDIAGLDKLTPNQEVQVTARKPSGELIFFQVTARLDSAIEIDYYRHDGILQYVLRNYIKNG